MTTVVCDFDFHETKHISHYTYAIARVILNTSVQIVLTLYSHNDNRWSKNIMFVLEGEDYRKWTDDSYISEVVAKKVAELMPPPPQPEVVEEVIVEEVKEEVIVEEAREEVREIVEEVKKVVKKRSKKAAVPIKVQ